MPSAGSCRRIADHKQSAGRDSGNQWRRDGHTETFTGDVSAEISGANIELKPELSRDELIRRTKPAVVCLQGLRKMGSGSFFTGTGVIATNAQVARGEESLLVILPGDRQLDAKVVYIDDDLDLALVKINVPPGNAEFPHLKLADVRSVRQGENVIAIGNPLASSDCHRLHPQKKSRASLRRPAG